MDIKALYQIAIEQAYEDEIRKAFAVMLDELTINPSQEDEILNRYKTAVALVRKTYDLVNTNGNQRP